MDAKFSQFEKEKDDKLSTVSGITTSVMIELFSKVLEPIIVTGIPSISDGISRNSLFPV